MRLSNSKKLSTHSAEFDLTHGNAAHFRMKHCRKAPDFAWLLLEHGKPIPALSQRVQFVARDDLSPPKPRTHGHLWCKDAGAGFLASCVHKKLYE